MPVDFSVYPLGGRDEKIFVLEFLNARAIVFAKGVMKLLSIFLAQR